MAHGQVSAFFAVDRDRVEFIAVGRRLEELHQQEDTQASPGAALVLASRQGRVDDWLSAKYPRLRRTNGYTSTDYTGARAGREAGRQANIGQTGVGAAGRGAIKS